MPDLDRDALARYGRRWRRRLLAIVVVLAVAVSLLGLVLIPVHSVSTELNFTPGSFATTEVSIPQAGWVTVHFLRVGDLPVWGVVAASGGMNYWMFGPTGAMFNDSGMGLTDAYSFWTWGGTYLCGAGFPESGYGTMGVWVNASWGVL